MLSLSSLWMRLRRRPVEPVPMVLYSRPGCHLCELMKREIERANVAYPFELREVDISLEPELEKMYGRSIPVLEVAGRVAFKSKLSASEFERKYARLSSEWDRARYFGRAVDEARGRG